MFKQEGESPDSSGEGTDDDFYDAEILDEMTTHRGELKLRTVSFKEEKLYQVSLKISFSCCAILEYSLFDPYA